MLNRIRNYGNENHLIQHQQLMKASVMICSQDVVFTFLTSPDNVWGERQVFMRWTQGRLAFEPCLVYPLELSMPT